jgi:hypothetical protein
MLWGLTALFFFLFVFSFSLFSVSFWAPFLRPFAKGKPKKGTPKKASPKKATPKG